MSTTEEFTTREGAIVRTAEGAPPEFVCAECAEEGTETVFGTPQALGTHRRNAHGHVSTNPRTLSANRANARKRAKKENRCPECAEQGIERVFDSKGGLSTHRNKKHGWVSDDPGAVAQRERAAKKKAQEQSVTVQESHESHESHEFDPNALLRAMFPQGIPPDVAIVKRTGDWLTEASEIHKMGQGE